LVTQEHTVVTGLISCYLLLSLLDFGDLHRTLFAPFFASDSDISWSEKAGLRSSLIGSELFVGP
jgi:hypothetical protein